MAGLIFDSSLMELIKAKGYKDSSIRQYSVSVKRLANVLTLGDKLPKFVDRDFMHMNFVVESENVLRREIPNVNSLAACTYAAYIVLDCYELCDQAKYYKELSKKCLKENSENTIYRDPNEKEKENFMSMEDVTVYFEKLEKEVNDLVDGCKDFKLLKSKYTFVNLYQRYLVCALYTHYPPLRGQDYYSTKFVRNDEDSERLCDENVYDVQKGTLYVRHHKTEGLLGTKVLVMPPVIGKICTVWSNINEGPNFIVNTKNGNMLTQQAFTGLLNRIFAPHKVSSSMLRKIYISSFLNSNPSVKQRKELAKIMGHQIGLQEFVYSRFRDL